MGFFDRLLKQDSQNSDNTIKPRKQPRRSLLNSSWMRTLVP